MLHQAMGHDGYGASLAAVAFVGLVMLFLAALLVGVAIVLATRRGRRGQLPTTETTPTATSAHGRPPGPSPAALMILDERLARGDLDLDTYRALRHELATGSAPTGAPPTGAGLPA